MNSILILSINYIKFSYLLDPYTFKKLSDSETQKLLQTHFEIEDKNFNESWEISRKAIALCQILTITINEE